MQQNKLIKALEDIGLSEKEALVYMTALALGPTTILAMARAANMKRTTVYMITTHLQQKGLMKMLLSGMKKLYSAESPEKLKYVLQQKHEHFNELLPQFLALYNLEGNENFIQYHEGLEAVKTVYMQLLKEVPPNSDYLVMGNQEEWYGADTAFFQKFIEKRSKLPLSIRLILQDSPLAREHKKYQKNYNEEVRILSKKSSLNTNAVITQNKLILHQLIPPIFAIVIENTSLIRMHRELFEIIWETLGDK